MLFSYKELSRLANLPKRIEVKDVVKAINSIGFEVESTSIFGDVEGIKFGKVLEVSKNPNADTLFVCIIEFSDKIRTIQTNATNIVEGMFVIGFIPGSRSGEIIFNKKELKGVISEGMLSSINEFGVNEELLRNKIDGIQPYENISLDMDPIEYLGLQDTIIDIDILSNRSDAQSYLVMANELAAYFGTIPIELKMNNPSIETNIKVTEGVHDELSLMEAKHDFIISLKEQIFLAKSGIKSINDIIDLTNLTLIMTGQPTHAYDKKRVGNNFSTNFSSEEVEIFGKKKVQLNKNLVITSDSQVVSIAGVIGLEKTGVLIDSNDFILEFGRFNIKEVRKSLKTIKLNTQAGNQSSKNMGKGTLLLAIKYLASKLNTFSPVINFDSGEEKIIDYSILELERVAGFEISKDPKYKDSIHSLEILGFKFNENKVTIPSYRHDIEQQQDLNEEVLRFYGYDNIPLIKPSISPFKVNIVKNFKKELAAKGYSEVMTYTLTSKEKNIFNPFDFKEDIELETYVSKEREVIRNSQIISTLEAVIYNTKRNIDNINIFSEGMINNGVKTISIASTTKTFNGMKQDIVNLLPKEITFKVTKDTKMHPGCSADIFLGDKKIGFIGKINPKVINDSTLIAEWITDLPFSKPKYYPYSSNPLKNRDVTFELNIKENIAPKLLGIKVTKILVIDEFKKDSINKITVRFIGTDEEINEIDKKFN